MEQKRTLIDVIGDNWFPLVILAVVVGGGAEYAISKYSEVRIAEAKAKAGIVLQEGRYNGNNIVDKFYVINGEKFPVEVDGKPVIEYFK